jgi:hypothetical protein
LTASANWWILYKVTLVGSRPRNDVQRNAGVFRRLQV